MHGHVTSHKSFLWLGCCSQAFCEAVPGAPCFSWKLFGWETSGQAEPRGGACAGMGGTQGLWYRLLCSPDLVLLLSMLLRAVACWTQYLCESAQMCATASTQRPQKYVKDHSPSLSLPDSFEAAIS